MQFSSVKFIYVKPQIHIQQEEIMPDIQIKISSKIAICKKRYLVSSNANYTVSFDFDNEWDAHTVRTARFIFDSQYTDVAFSGNTVTMPKIPPCECLGIGVYSDALASTTADVGCVLSVKDCPGEPVGELTDEQYESLLALINSLDLRQIEKIERTESGMKISFSNGTSTSLALYDGVSVSTAAIDNEGKLRLTLSNGSVLTAGTVKGEKGEKGEKGDTGAKGEKGDTGEKGAQGEKGDRGEKGEKGDAFKYSDFTAEQLSALKGEKGDRGEKGAQGEKGEKGEKGDTGSMPPLVTALSASSTNSAAPGAKCVYDAIKAAIGTALGGSY